MKVCCLHALTCVGGIYSFIFVWNFKKGVKALLLDLPLTLAFDSIYLVSMAFCE